MLTQICSRAQGVRGQIPCGVSMLTQLALAGRCGEVHEGDTIMDFMVCVRMRFVCALSGICAHVCVFVQG